MQDRVAIVFIRCLFLFVGVLFVLCIGDPDILDEIVNILHAYSREIAAGASS